MRQTHFRFDEDADKRLNAVAVAISRRRGRITKRSETIRLLIDIGYELFVRDVPMDRYVTQLIDAACAERTQPA